MRQIVYSLHFRGNARPAGGSGKLLRATAAAVSCSFTTLVTSAGVDSTFEAKATDEDAILESEITLVSDHGFSEGGNVSFGEVSVVRFRSLGEAQLTPGESGLMYGGAVLKVESGEGQFSGATGLITSNFTLTEAGELNAYHLGVINLL